VRAGRSDAAPCGKLAPRGALIKVGAADPALLEHRGPAVVFDGMDDMLARIDAEDLPVTGDSVLVLRGVGPKGVPGMPEWGQIPVMALTATHVSDVLSPRLKARQTRAFAGEHCAWSDRLSRGDLRAQTDVRAVRAAGGVTRLSRAIDPMAST
jgi:hypothetical protein